MKEFFRGLFEYSHHYNQKLATVFIDNPGQIAEKGLKLFSHLLNAHHVWNNRIEEKPAVFGIWELHSIQVLADIDQANFEQTLQILENCDLNNSINYSNSKGQPFNNSIRDVLFHVINHSTYHRGQIATEFRLHGLEPLVTDYIFYRR